jgi:hypothetical protein
MMASHTAFMVSMLMLAGVQADDTQFLSKFVTPNLKHMQSGTQDFNTPKIVGKEEETAAQNMFASDSNMPTSISAVNVALVSLAAMVGLSLGALIPLPSRRRGLESDMSVPLAEGSAMELEARGSVTNSRRAGWGQMSSQNSRPLTLAYVQSPGMADAQLESMVGVSVELGKNVWDPLEVAQWRDLDEMRACELANGRVAMLASVGWVAPQVNGLWGTGLPVKTTDPIDAILQVPTAAWCQIILFCGVIEAARWNWEQQRQGKETPLPITQGWGGRKPNPNRPFYDPFDIYPKDKAGQERMQLREIKHARLAMLGFAGFFSNHFIPGSVPGMEIFPNIH